MNLKTDENCDYCDVPVTGREPCLCHGLLLCDSHWDLYHNTMPDRTPSKYEQPTLPGINWDAYEVEK